MCNAGKSKCGNPVSGCVGTTTCNGKSVTVTQTPTNPQESYVGTGYDSSVVEPYFDIATKYGFANYMFQTNEGPSNPAHQFIFSGTSSAAGKLTQHYYQDFTSENPSNEPDTGCAGDPANKILQIDQNGNEHNQSVPPILPCFDHRTLADLLDPNFSWKYYTAPSPPTGNGLWTAPNSIIAICVPGPGSVCTGSEWQNHVVLDSKNILDDLEPPPNLTGIGCDLPAVSWVVPYGDRSDHPGFVPGQTDSKIIEGGPAWVAAVINEVGTTTCTDNVNGQAVPYWQDTAIFVTWDDFGGFWDHVDPNGTGGPGVKVLCQSWGCGYVYGFRVPLLVVSAYTPAGYVSGDTRTHGETFPYLHDFGSILAFIENNFLGFNAIGQINPQYNFADNFAPDYQPNPPNVPLADFFPIHQNQPRQFQPIILPPAWQGYDANYFLNYNGPIMDPDNDAIDND
jgi:hypothetical protein